MSKGKKFLFTGLLTGLLMSGSLFAQDAQEPILLNIDGEAISRTEFLSIYQKNNVNGEVMDKKSVTDYLDLFINFKLKVKEAESMGMDTARAFVEELQGYRKQLAEPYLIDEEVNKELLEEAYERAQTDLRASHILIQLNKNAKPKDTLKAYQNAIRIRERILAGEKFASVAAEVSDDPSARDSQPDPRKPVRKGNRGDLGYFSVFDMVYPFETGAYNTQIGDVSMPIRSDFGYHLIQVTDRKPAMGKVQVAHILLLVPENSTAEDSLKIEKRIQQAYQEIQSGSDFKAIVRKYSDDKGSASKGGVLPWFGSNRMIPDFIYQISQLNDVNEITQPFQSQYGWHIVKLLERKPIKTFDDEKTNLKQKMAKNDRSLKSKESLIRKIKAEYGFSAQKENLQPLYTAVNDSIFRGLWKPERAAGLNAPLFTIGTKTCTQRDFTNYLADKQKRRARTDIETFVNQEFKAFVEKECVAYEDQNLEKKYPEFRLLMNEYRDGILLFNLTDEKIWSYAIKDTTGLENFFNANRDDYKWPKRLEASILNFSDEKQVKPAIALLKKDHGVDFILNEFNQDSVINVKSESGKFQKGDNPLIDKAKWKKGVNKPVKNDDGSVSLIVVHEVLKPQPKELSETRGLVTADYQNQLEKQWVEELRDKYEVRVSKEVLSTLKK